MKILKFGASWCSGCLVMRPRWREIEISMPELKTEYYDFDKDKDMVDKYQINENLPTFVFLDNDGNELLRLSGEVDKGELMRIIEENKNR